MTSFPQKPNLALEFAPSGRWDAPSARPSATRLDTCERCGEIGMKISSLLFVAVLFGGSALNAAAQPKADAARKLCGWFENPTPGNASLIDREGEWTAGIQGGHQAEGEWPTFKPRQWVRTGSSYGYGCACLVAIADSSTHAVGRIVSAYSQPLTVCRNDRSLPKWPT